MSTRILLGLLLALLLGGGLVLAAIAPGVGLIVLLGIVVLVVLGVGSIVAGARGRREPPRPADLLGPGGPDDPSAR